MADRGHRAGQRPQDQEDRAPGAQRARAARWQMGTAWDTAHAALFLASDEAQFITGILLAVDGGMSVRIG